MTAEQWQSCWSIYNEAKGLPASGSQAFVESLSSDPEVILEVLTLLNASDPANENAQAIAPRVGAVIGKYQVESMLGVGGMGEVYAARDTALGRTAALKLLRPDSVSDQAAVKRFVGEARAASALNHPNIVTVYEVIPSDFGLAIAMELVEGKSLREHIAAGLSIPDVIQCGRQIALALEAAHAASIVHRDIKPENIVLRPDGVVKVLDFGLAREIPAIGESAASSTAGLLKGTLKYMSPEQLRGERVTGASDVFALGTVLYELSTGRHPFASGQLWEVAGAIANADPVFPSKWNPAVPVHLDHLILGMLAKNPEQRPSASDAARVLAGEQKVPRVRRNRKIGWGWWAAAAVAISAGVAVSRLDWRAQPESVFFDLTTNAEGNPVLAAAISPDGKRFAYADAGGLYLRDAVQDSKAFPLNSAKSLHAQRIAWAPNGGSLIVDETDPQTRQQNIRSVDLDGGTPRLIREDGREGTLSPDGKRIAFLGTGAEDLHKLMVASVTGGEARWVQIPGHEIGKALLAWSANGNRVGYLKMREEDSVYAWIDLASGEVTTSTPLPPTKTGIGTVIEDGTLLLRAADNNLWIHTLDPRTGALRAPSRQITHSKPNPQDYSGYLSTSADGRRVLTIRTFLQNEIFVAEFDPKSGRLRDKVRLTFDKRRDLPRAWTRDGKTVIFESDRREGKSDLYHQSVGDRFATAYNEEPLAKAFPQLAADGRWILFMGWLTSRREAALYRIPVAGGASTPVPIGAPLDEFRCAMRGRCVLRTSERDQFVFWELDAVSGKGRELVRVPGAVPAPDWRWAWDWALSSSGLEVAIPVHDASEARLRVFALEGPRAGVERIIEIAGQHRLGAVSYQADDMGWFVAVFNSNSQAGAQILLVDRTGQSRTLFECAACYLNSPLVIASPDGRHVALTERMHEGNVALLDR